MSQPNIPQEIMEFENNRAIYIEFFYCIFYDHFIDSHFNYNGEKSYRVVAMSAYHTSSIFRGIFNLNLELVRKMFSETINK